MQMQSTSEREDVINNTPSQEGEMQENAISLISLELLQNIFSFLKPDELPETMLVNTTWQANVIVQFRSQQISLIKKLIEQVLSISKKNNANTKVKECCCSVLANPILADSQNLSQVQTSLKNFKIGLLSILPHLTATELEQVGEIISTQELPIGLAGLIDFIKRLSNNYKQLEQANAELNLKAQSELVGDVIKDLFKMGCFEKAFELAKPTYGMLEMTATELVQEGNDELAYQILHKITDNELKNHVKKMIHMAHMQQDLKEYNEKQKMSRDDYYNL